MLIVATFLGCISFVGALEVMFLTELGGCPSINLTASLTDVLALDGGETDRRMDRIAARQIPVLTMPDDNLVETNGTPTHSFFHRRNAFHSSYVGS